MNPGFSIPTRYLKAATMDRVIAGRKLRPLEEDAMRVVAAGQILDIGGRRLQPGGGRCGQLVNLRMTGWY
jgi:hypothetical protein